MNAQSLTPAAAYRIRAHDLLTVQSDNGSEAYASIEDLVRVWSVG